MKHIITIVMLLATLIMSSCRDHEPSNSGLTSRTILVYMSANNSLGQKKLDVADLNEMVQAARRQEFGSGRLLVYHHEYGSSAPELIEVTADGIKTLVKYDLSASSASKSRMEKVISDMKAKAPAQSYGLVLWSHGSGWIQNGMTEPAQVMLQAPAMYSFGQDMVSSQESRWMNVTTLAKVLENKNFDFVYFDCCYMAGIEVVYELRNVTRHIVASATELPEEGMPYDRNLGCLFAIQPDLVSAARNTFNYYDSRTDYMRSCTMSVIDCYYIDEIAEFTRDIYQACSESAYLPSVSGIQRFSLSKPCYYYDFEDYVQTISSSSGAYSNWKTSMEDAVMYKASTPSMWGGLLNLDKHCGLSTYIVKNAADAQTMGYNQLSWWRDVASVMFSRN